MNYLPPLHIHIFHHPKFSNGTQWVDSLLKWFSGDPEAFAVPPADIPVFVWTGKDGSPPSMPPKAEAKQTVAVFLVDDHWMGCRNWRRWSSDSAKSKSGTEEIVVVAVSRNADNLQEPLKSLQMIRLDKVNKERRFSELVLSLTHFLATRMLQLHAAQTHTRLFLSHAQADGKEFALALKGFLDLRSNVKTFFDVVDIQVGDNYPKELTDALLSSVVVVILTDRFSSRYWCGWEVVTAKEHRRPMVLVDALEHGEPTSLAYAGNIRTIRWDRARLQDESVLQNVIAAALLELLRAEHNRARIDAVRRVTNISESAVILGMPPELATLPGPSPKAVPTDVLYPDPPLPVYEIELIKRHRADLKLASMAQVLAHTTAGAKRLQGKRIAISISDSPDMEMCGLRKIHLERLWTRLATLLLASGAELAYGGDLREKGYTQQLWDLVRGTLDAGGVLPDDVVHNYLGWPIHLQLNESERAQLSDVICTHPIPMPQSLKRNPEIFIPLGNLDPADHFAWTVSMTAMREVMALECQARILIGGQFLSVSPIPGIVEEFLTFAQLKPVYLVGGFGGMTAVLIRAVQGERPPELTMEYQSGSGKRTPIIEYYNQQVGSAGWEHLEKADFEGLVNRLNSMGTDSLNNGLTPEENLRIFQSRDLLEITSLVLDGLGRRLNSV